MIKKTTLALLGIFHMLFVMSQQMPPLYEKHYSYEYAINPAVTGRDYYPVVNFSQKKYMFKNDHSPSSSAVGATLRMGRFQFYNPKMMLNKSKILSKSRMGLGAFLMRDQNGPMEFMHAAINYAYFIPINKQGDQLSFGLSAQLAKYSINDGILEPLDEGDIFVYNSDELPYVPEAGFGIYYHNDQLNVGFSANDLLLIDNPNNLKRVTENKRDFFIHLGYKFFLKHFELEPSVFTAYVDENPLYYSSNLKLYFLYYNWFSVTYKSSKSLSYSLGIKINRFHVAYIYEHAVSEMITDFSGSHEIMFGLNVGLFEAEGLRKLAK